MRILTIKTKFKTNTLLLVSSLILIPLMIGFQPYTPRFLEVVIIGLRLIIGPLLIIFYLRSNSNFNWIIILIAYLVISSLIFLPPVFDDFKLMFLNTTASVAFFMLGRQILNSDESRYKFRYLAYGVNLFNIISLIVYLLVAIDILNIRAVYSLINRPLDVDLSRFALGNAIELPFGMTCFLFSAIVISDRKEPFIFSTTLNLTLALISQSRVVIIIALLLFFYEFMKCNWKTKTIFIFLFLCMIPFVIDTFQPILNSIIARLKGNDFNSGHIRLYYLLTVLKHFDLGGLFLGHGVTSSSVLMKEILGQYKSVESVLLQLIYDIGLIGFLVLFLPVFFYDFNYLVKGQYRLALIFVYIQLLLFLPVNGYMPFTFFLFGVCSSPKNRELPEAVENTV
jgi:hypothetical protein